MPFICVWMVIPTSKNSEFSDFFNNTRREPGQQWAPGQFLHGR